MKTLLYSVMPCTHIKSMVKVLNMKNWNPAIILGILTALSTAGAYALLSAPQPTEDVFKTEATPNAVAQDSDLDRLALDELRKDLLLLKSTVNTLRGELQAQSAQIASLVFSVPTDSVPLLESSDNNIEENQQTPDPEAIITKLEQEQQAAEQKRAERFASLATHFDQEFIDQQWSAQAIDTIAQALASEELAQIPISDADCRATLCRLEVQFDNDEELRVFQRQFPSLVGEILPRTKMLREELGNGRSNLVVYLAREGHRFPR